MLKSILITLSVLLFSVVALPQPAVAGPILTQELLAEDTNGDIISIGAISFDTDDLDVFFPGNGELLAWQSFTLFGYEIDRDFFYVALGFDPDNIFAGLDFLSFDVTDIDMTFSFVGFFDLLDPALPPEYYYQDLATGDYTYFNTFNPGQATAVPAPAGLWLFIAAVGGLLLRQRQYSLA